MAVIVRKKDQNNRGRVLTQKFPKDWNRVAAIENNLKIPPFWISNAIVVSGKQASLHARDDVERHHQA